MPESFKHDMEQHCIKCDYSKDVIYKEVISYKENYDQSKTIPTINKQRNLYITSSINNLYSTSFNNRGKISNLYKRYCSFLI